MFFVVKIFQTIFMNIEEWKIRFKYLKNQLNCVHNFLKKFCEYIRMENPSHKIASNYLNCFHQFFKNFLWIYENGKSKLQNSVKLFQKIYLNYLHKFFKKFS